MKCFTIMPFTVHERHLPRYSDDPDHWVQVYRGLIVPAVREAGLEPEREDEDVATRFIAEDIWRKIEDAGLVLCDLSAHNPNVYLELGWALRADKKIVLIKDDLTEFTFDLNQLQTFKYSHLLQPIPLERARSELAEAIRKTLHGDVRRYSLVERLRLGRAAAEAVANGNVEVGLLTQLVADVGALSSKREGAATPVRAAPVDVPVWAAENLVRFLVGSTWRKKNDLEHLIFEAQGQCYNNCAGHPSWTTNDYTLGDEPNVILIRWSVDDMESTCRFSKDYRSFVEEENPQSVWYLLSAQPYTPAWGV